MELSKVLQIIGVVFVSPTVLNILYNFVLMLSVRFAKYIRRGKIDDAPTGIFIARRYLQALNIVRKRKEIGQVVVNLSYTLMLTLVTSLLLLSLVSWIPINHPVLDWIPIWLKVVASVYAGIMVIDALFFAIWDYVLLRFPLIRNWASSLPTQTTERNPKNILSGYFRILLVNPMKKRPLFKLLVNITSIVLIPLAGLIVSAQYMLLLVLHYATRSNRARNSMAVIGFALVIIGIAIH